MNTFDINLNINLKGFGLDRQQMAQIETHFHSLKRLISMNNAELTAKLDALATQAEKVKAEILAELAKVSAGTTTPEQDAAIARIETVLGDFDARNPDEPPVEPPVA